MPNDKYVLGYILDSEDSESKFTPIIEGSFVAMARLKQMNEQTEYHGKKLIKGCHWEVLKVEDVFAPKVTKLDPVFEDVFNKHFPGLSVANS